MTHRSLIGYDSDVNLLQNVTNGIFSMSDNNVYMFKVSVMIMLPDGPWQLMLLGTIILDLTSDWFRELRTIF